MSHDIKQMKTNSYEKQMMRGIWKWWKTNCLYIGKKTIHNLQMSHGAFWLAYEKQMSHDPFFDWLI
jgi:hypothetical protein